MRLSQSATRILKCNTLEAQVVDFNRMWKTLKSNVKTPRELIALLPEDGGGDRQ